MHSPDTLRSKRHKTEWVFGSHPSLFGTFHLPPVMAMLPTRSVANCSMCCSNFSKDSQNACWIWRERGAVSGCMADVVAFESFQDLVRHSQNEGYASVIPYCMDCLGTYEERVHVLKLLHRLFPAVNLHKVVGGNESASRVARHQWATTALLKCR